MTEVVGPVIEGEVLDGPRQRERSRQPVLRHGFCGYDWDAIKYHSMGRALCGQAIRWADAMLPRQPGDPKCPQCVAAAQDHALRCDCWRRFNGPIPRRWETISR